MPKFRDTKGREWELNITLGHLPKLKEAGFDLDRIVSNQRLSESMYGSPEQIGKVLWILIEEQAVKLAVTPEGFACAMDYHSLNGAYDALTESLINFFHHRLPAVAAKLKKQLPKLQQEIEAEVEKVVDEQMSQVSSKFAGALRASLASTQDR